MKQNSSDFYSRDVLKVTISISLWAALSPQFACNLSHMHKKENPDKEITRLPTKFQ